MSARHLSRLNEAQLRAVLHPPNVPLQILAGPGSGKTRVLTSRIAHLIEQHKIQPSSICAVTFTNKAAKEMRERLTNLIGKDQTEQIKLGTFHALCALFLRRHASIIGLDGNFSICDADESKKVVTKLLKAHKETLAGPSSIISEGNVLSLISKAKAKGYSPEEFHRFLGRGDPSTDYAVIAEIYAEYEKTLRQSNSLDFDDLLVFGVRLFAHQRVVEWCKHVLVDEFQDTNTMQYELMRHIAASSRCVTVVGDPDQSIYGWRSAEIENLERMERDFPSTTQIMLEQNYRSTGSILSTCMAIISQDKGRIEKTLRTSNPAGFTPVLKRFPTEHEEASFVATEIKRLIAFTGGMLTWNDFVILLRMSSLSRTLEAALQREGIPCRVLAGHKFFDRLEVKDLLAYLQLVDNPYFVPAFSRVINTPSRTIGEKTVAEILAQADKRRISPVDLVERIHDGSIPDIKPPVRKKLASFVQTIRSLRLRAQEGESTSELIRHLLDLTEYEAWLRKTQPDWDSRWENVQELINFASEVERTTPAPREDHSSKEQPAEWTDSQAEFDTDALADAGGETPLRLFLQASMLSTDVEAQDESEKTPKVTIATCHAAKGLEWPVVMIPAVEKGIFPSARAEDIEEERRLLYVACTRAQGLLYLTHADSRMVNGRRNRQMVSEFILAVRSKLQMLFRDDLPNLKKNDRDVLTQVLNRDAPNESDVSRMVAEYQRTVKCVSTSARRSPSPYGRASSPTRTAWRDSPPAILPASSLQYARVAPGSEMPPRMPARNPVPSGGVQATMKTVHSPNYSSQRAFPSSQPCPGPSLAQPLAPHPAVAQRFIPQSSLPRSILLQTRPKLSSTTSAPGETYVQSRPPARPDTNTCRSPLRSTLHVNGRVLAAAAPGAFQTHELRPAAEDITQSSAASVKLAGGKRRLGMGRTAVGYPNKKFRPPGT
ncbi:UvrD-helicase-domain-containing protein [Obba rivulosa]|uniref:DNA 3'-5' helicase n=1 Tax=Obba rivulosa TaxID=1052685 RepID=A0A8E2AZS0_9APHY|nr:UvrD-helicase-domain-containing protein [Obba rivulosa]